MPRASCTATSSRRTSSSPGAARRRCWTSAWRSSTLGRRGAGADRRHRDARRAFHRAWSAPPSAPSPTCRPSRRAAKISTRAPTCSRSASCSTRWPPAGQSFPGHTTAVVFDGILNREPRRRARSTRACRRARPDHRQGARKGPDPALPDRCRPAGGSASASGATRARVACRLRVALDASPAGASLAIAPPAATAVLSDALTSPRPPRVPPSRRPVRLRQPPSGSTMPAAAGTQGSTTAKNTQWALIGTGAVAIAALAAGLWVMSRSTPVETPQSSTSQAALPETPPAPAPPPSTPARRDRAGSPAPGGECGCREAGDDHAARPRQQPSRRRRGRPPSRPLPRISPRGEQGRRSRRAASRSPSQARQQSGRPGGRGSCARFIVDYPGIGGGRRRGVPGGRRSPAGWTPR